MKTSSKIILSLQVLVIIAATGLVLWKTGVLEKVGVLDWLGFGSHGEEEDTGETGENTDETNGNGDEAEPYVPKEWEKIACGNEVVQLNYSRELDYCLEEVQVIFAADFAVTNNCLARKALVKYLNESGKDSEYFVEDVRYLGSWFREEYRDMDADGVEERYWKGTVTKLKRERDGLPVYVNQKGELISFSECD